MTHVKTQVRKAVEDRLRAVVPELALVVSSARMNRPFQTDELPGATVEVAETIDTLGNQRPENRPIKRNLTVTVILFAPSDIDSVEDDLEALQVTVERGLLDGADLGVRGLNDWILESASSVEISVEAGLGVIQLRYTAFITTRAGDPTMSI